MAVRERDGGERERGIVQLRMNSGWNRPGTCSMYHLIGSYLLHHAISGFFPYL
jgi:hypothetical protein